MTPYVLPSLILTGIYFIIAEYEVSDFQIRFFWEKMCHHCVQDIIIDSTSKFWVNITIVYTPLLRFIIKLHKYIDLELCAFFSLHVFYLEFIQTNPRILG